MAGNPYHDAAGKFCGKGVATESYEKEIAQAHSNGDTAKAETLQKEYETMMIQADPKSDVAQKALQRDYGTVATTEKKKIGQRELNNIAKESNDENLLMQAATDGSVRVKVSLGKNPNATADSLRVAYESIPADNMTNRDARKTLTQNNNFPIENMTDEDFEKIAKTYNGVRRLSASSGITDSQAKIIMNEVKNDNTFRTMGAVIAQNSVNLSDDYKLELMNSNDLTKKLSIEDGMYPVDKISSLDPKIVNNIDGRKIKGSDTIRGVVELFDKGNVDEINYSNLANNSDTPSDVIEHIVKDEKTRFPEAFYNHKNVSTDAKKVIFDKSPVLQSEKKVDDIVSSTYKNNIAELRSDLIVDSKVSGSGSYQKITRMLDVNKVKELGLSKQDVFTVLGRGSYNAKLSYNEATGEFNGAIDSSG